MPALAVGHWVLAYPRRYHFAWVILAGSVATVSTMPYLISQMCGGSMFMFYFDLVILPVNPNPNSNPNRNATA